MLKEKKKKLIVTSSVQQHRVYLSLFEKLTKKVFHQGFHVAHYSIEPFLTSS